MQSTAPVGSPNPRLCADSDISEVELQSLSRALVLLASHLDRPCENAQAFRLLCEVIKTNPGTIDDLWWRWVLEAGRSLGLALRVSDIPVRDVSPILQSGACVVAERRAAEVRGLDFRKLDAKRFVMVGSPREKSTSREPPAPPELLRVIIAVKDPDLGAAHHHHVAPWVILARLLAPDRKDLWSLVVISGIAGILMLSVPITAQQLVRAVTFATLYQPILVLSLLLLGLLGFVAVLQGLQVYVSEIIQRRLFIRIANQVTRQLTQADGIAWRQYSMPELVNRFLEVAIVQKVTAALMVDGITILLTTVIGMSVMAVYHPFLLGYDILLLLLLATIYYGFGRNGVQTAIQESRTKYGVLSWLEDMARCPGVFRTGGVELLAMQRSDVLCADYLRARRSHFSILMRQIVLVLILQVVATTALLGLGGFLVLNEQLTLGQLVAAELIVAMIVASFAKLGKHLEGWYDLLASVDKLSHLLDIPVEPSDGLVGLPRTGPAEVVIRDASVHQSAAGNDGVASGELLRAAPGDAVVLINWNSSIIQDLADAWRGLRGLSGPSLYLDGIRIEDVRSDVLRQHVTVVNDLEFLPGTIMENIHLSRPGVSEADVLEACQAVGLMDDLHCAGLSLATQVLPTGWPLSALQKRRLILARAFAGRPRVLFIDQVCDGFSQSEFAALWSGMGRYRSRTTILIATVRPDIAQLVGHAFPGPLNCHAPESRTH